MTIFEVGMIRGITPIDTAFELMGLHQAQVLMRFIFLETMAGKLVFALGFLLSIQAGLEKGNFKPVFIFLMMFFSLWLLLVIPRAKVVDPISSMERSGYQEVTAEQILKKSGYGEIVASPALDVISRTADSLVTASAAVFERGGNARGYLASPFLLIKVSVLTSGIIARGITDPQLEERTIRFYQDYFWPAVKKLGSDKDRVWPGDPDIVAVYKEDGRSAWAALREALYQSCDQDKIFSRMFDRFYDGKVDKDAVVRSLLAQEILLKPGRYIVRVYATRLQHTPWPGQSQRGVVLTEEIMMALPFMQGGALFLLWSSFPVFLGVVFLTRRMASLVLLLGILFAVKVWTLAWVVLDKISTSWFDLGNSLMWESPVTNMFIASAALILPLLMTAAAVFLSRIKVEGRS